MSYSNYANMKNALPALLSSIFITLPFILNAQSHSVAGSVADTEGNPVGYATVVMQTADSVYVDAVVTDAEGRFAVGAMPERYRLIVQHLLYETLEVEMSGADAGTLVLRQKEMVMDDVMVRGERPMVKVEGGILSYDVQQVAESKVVSNAYEAILQLPGVREENEKITLAGAGNPTIIINGRPTTMSYEQLVMVLKNLPVSRLEKAEVMYSAPARYHVRGAAINIVLATDAEEKPKLQGEVNGSYVQMSHAGGSAGATLLYTSPKVSADFMYNYNYHKVRSGTDIFSRHTINTGEYREIGQRGGDDGENGSHFVRLGMDYMPDAKNTLSFVYNTNMSFNGKNRSFSEGNFSDTDVRSEYETLMHNFNIDYKAGFGLRVGADHTYYKYPVTQYFEDTGSGGSQTGFVSRSRQRIDRTAFYADQSHDLGARWKLNYGGKFAYSKDHSYQRYEQVSGGTFPSSENTLREYIYDLYAGFEKSFSEKLSLNASLTGEYYKLASDDEWAPFPQIQATYMSSADHILQFSFSSNKGYPEYWAKQNVVSHFDGYSEGHGNPYLKPYNYYAASFNYIYRQKYVFGLTYNYMPDYFQQQPYQASDRFALIYNTINWDYQQSVSAYAVIPFKAGSWLDSRLTLMETYTQAKCDRFFDTSFNNEKFSTYIALNNTFTLSSKPDIKLELEGYYYFEPMQGIFDMTDVWNLSAGAKWVFADKKAELRARIDDIFDSAIPEMRVRRSGQNLDMKVITDRPVFTLSFSYKFGGYTGKERKEVDNSRFRQ